MGKIDDMRRLREQAFADAEKRASNAKRAPAAPPAAKAAPASPPPSDDREEIAQPSRPTRGAAKKKETSSKSGGSVDAQGKCPDCGKMKPLANGVMASHQKGFGKACPGSKKKPD